jgi:ribA/ribD-fused uncharacterized protein
MINEFKGDHAFLSNFWPAEVVLNRELYPTVEHAFQAAKTVDPYQRRRIARADNPGVAKVLGRKVALRPDWEQVKLKIMFMLVTQKFERPDLRVKLLATYPEELEEGNRWKDVFWGVDINTGKGENHLGQILMAVRSYIHFREAEL